MTIVLGFLTLSLAAALTIWGLCYLGSRPDCYQCPTCHRYWDREGNRRIKVASGRVIELQCRRCRRRRNDADGRRDDADGCR